VKQEHFYSGTTQFESAKLDVFGGSVPIRRNANPNPNPKP